MKVLGFSMRRLARQEAREVADRLEELDVFPGASVEDLLTIAKHGTVITVVEGWSLMLEKTPADKSYVMLEGTASVRRADREIATVTAGDLVGEVALVNHKLRSATVVATSPLRVLHFTKEAVDTLRLEVPAFGRAIEHSTKAHSR